MVTTILQKLSMLFTVVYKDAFKTTRPDVNLFSSPLFAGFHKVLDGEMKHIQLV